ncbi:MAG: AAA family ATPase [Paenibacillaceae bacterium]
MKIHRMYVNGFGIHRERTFDLDIDAQAIVFYGHNEAGKSTLMSFVRSMLFGFPKRNNRLERYEPLSGGVHGGALTILDPMGTEIRLERYEKNGSLKLVYPSGTEAGEAALQSLLGGLTADLYRNLFAFSLSELQQIDTLHAEEISGFLFNAGMGISGSMMAQAERKLAQQMELLYKRNGTKQTINEQLRVIEQSELELRRSKERSGRFQDWQVELASLDEIIAIDENELSLHREELDWLNKCLQSRDSWIQLLEVESELRDLPEFIDFPENVLGRFEQAQENLERAYMELQGIQQGRIDATEQLSQLTVNKQLIEQRAELEQLLEAAIVYTDSAARVADHSAEMEGYRVQLQRYLRLISLDWTEDQLQQFPLSIHHREQVSAYAERFDSNDQHRQSRLNDRERLVEQADQYRFTKREQQIKLNEISQQMDSLFPSLITMGREQVHSYEAEVHKLWERTKKQASDVAHVEERLADAHRNEQLLRTRRGPEYQRVLKDKPQNTQVKLLAIALNIVLPLWMILGLNRMMTGIVIFLLLGLFNVYLWLQKDSRMARPEMEDSLYREASTHRDRMEQEVGRVRSQWDELLKQLCSKLSMLPTSHTGHAEAAAGRSWSEGRERTDAMASIQQLEPWVESVLLQINEYMQADKELQDAENQLRTVVQALDERVNRLATMTELDSKQQQDEAILKQEWGQWLEQYQLPVDLSVESMSTMFQYAESGLQLYDQITRMSNKLAVYEESQHSFERTATRFLNQLGLDIPLNSTHIVYELKKLKEQLDTQLSIQENRRHIEQQLNELISREHICSGKVMNMHNKLSELLEAVHAKDEDELRRSVRLYDRRIELEQSKRHLEVVIFTWVKEEHQQQLFQTLEQSDIAQLEQQLIAVSEAVMQIELRLNESKDRRGGLRKEMDNLQSGGQHAELLQRHQEHIAEYQQLTSKWAELALSAELMRRAKEIYERERQPGVLLRASHYMRTITDGQFVRVVSRIGEKSIFVERENGQQLDSTYLSRGTAEQLYLAMRFALADEYSKTVALPLIMDDIFVNFDADRLARTLMVLSDVAMRHQIIIFTCHEHVALALQSALSRVQLIDLEVEEARR